MYLTKKNILLSSIAVFFMFVLFAVFGYLEHPNADVPTRVFTAFMQTLVCAVCVIGFLILYLGSKENKNR